MSAELISILVLVAVFVVATTRSLNMGVLSFAAAFGVGTLLAGMDEDAILAGFPGDLFVVLVGVTFLFGFARVNGTTDWLVHSALRLVGGRVVLIPWVIFGVAALMTGIGAVSPAAAAILAPVALRAARNYGIDPLLMGVLLVHGTQAGSFSMISVYGTTVNAVVAREGLAGNPAVLFLASLAVNLVVAAIAFVVLGGLRLPRTDVRVPSELEPDPTSARTSAPRAETRTATDGPGGVRDPAAGDEVPGIGASTGGGGADGRSDATSGTGPSGAPRLTPARATTLASLLVLVVGALVLDLDVGLTAITLGVLLSVVWRDTGRAAVNEITWSTVLLICGVLTYVSVLETMGTIDYAGEAVGNIGVPLLAALLFCYIGGVVSAFASSVGIMGALIPLAVPFLLTGAVGPVGMVTALAVSATVVDVSPFSTNGALVLANSAGFDRDLLFRRLLIYASIVVAVAPALIWLALVVPGFG
ncbi:SLC13 family permease [Actinoalloteichus caeruleus]|uniref:Dicarboxylate carrier protein MatC N-terminus n=1 Tax=Actinoalloteichus caeruleus DSM 43889 TaxID=1120930 RepID=A0ABT1JFE6_ACTCY|nr:SLC13 family permease [Actinoalloteichus caeruleus]MCP2331009.1 Dicarboxylate carrier protein MatC N-terminus [Actinoalloteichus caeruleus DSM 43889]